MDKKVGGRQEELAEPAARSEREWSFELTGVGAPNPRLRNNDSGRAEVSQVGTGNRHDWESVTDLASRAQGKSLLIHVQALAIGDWRTKANFMAR